MGITSLSFFSSVIKHHHLSISLFPVWICHFVSSSEASAAVAQCEGKKQITLEKERSKCGEREKDGGGVDGGRSFCHEVTGEEKIANC